MKASLVLRPVIAMLVSGVATVSVFTGACADNSTGDNPQSGGAPPGSGGAAGTPATGGSTTGGTATGGVSTGGVSTGGVATGGTNPTGGAGGAGGAGTGGAPTGGASGSAGTGGAATGGSSGGGAGGGLSGSGGASGAGAGSGGAGGRGGTAGAGGSGGMVVNSMGPCDIYAATSPATPCVAAYSTVRVLRSAYTGPLYQVRKGGPDPNTGSGGTTQDIGIARGWLRRRGCARRVLRHQRLHGLDSLRPVRAEQPSHGCEGGLLRLRHEPDI